MQALLRVSGAIDWINDRLGVLSNFLVLLCCAISAGNPPYGAMGISSAG